MKKHLMTICAALLSFTPGCDAAIEEAEIAEARAHGEQVAAEYAAKARADEAMVEVAADERPEDGPALVLAPTSEPLQAIVEGHLDRDILRRIVVAHINEVRYCYNQGLAKDAALSGQISVQFTITPEGRVADASALASSLGDASVDRCITEAVGRWMFPRPKDGGRVVVTYPFMLSPG